MAKKKSMIVTENDLLRALSVFNDPENQQYFSDDVQELVRKIAGLSEDGISEPEAEEFFSAAKKLKVAVRNFAGDIKGAAAVVLSFAEKRVANIEQGAQEGSHDLNERIVDLETENVFLKRERDQFEAEAQAVNIENAELEAAKEELLQTIQNSGLKDARIVKHFKQAIRSNDPTAPGYKKGRQVAGLRAMLRAADEDAKADKEAITLLNSEVEAYREEYDRVKSDAEAKARQNKRNRVIAGATIGVLGLTAAASVATNVALANRASELNKQNAAYVVTIDKSEKDLNDMQKYIEATMEDWNAQIKAANEESARQEKLAQERQSKIDELTAQIAATEARIAEYQARINEFPELEEIYLKALGLQAQELRDLTAQKQALEQENGVLQDELNRYKNQRADVTSVPSLNNAQTSDSFTVSSHGVTFTCKNGEITQVTIQDEQGRTITTNVVNNKVSTEGVANEVSTIMGTTVSPEDEGISKLTTSINTALDNIAQNSQTNTGKDTGNKANGREVEYGPSL